MVEGEKYVKYLCEECKINVAKETAKLTWKDKLRPQRLAKKSVKWLCYSCRKKIKEVMKQ